MRKLPRSDMLREVLLSIFQRKGRVSPNTRPFHEFDEKDQRQVLDGVSLHPGELPVIAHILSKWCWTLITTSRIIVQNESESWEIRNEELLQVKPLNFGAVQKREMNGLLLTALPDNEERIIHVDRGAPFSGFWNVLQYLAGCSDKELVGELGTSSPGVEEQDGDRTA